MATPASPTPPPKLPSKGFWIALVIFLVTAVVGVVMIVVAFATIANAIGDFAEIDVPQTAEVRLSSGEYWVFAGSPSDSALSASLVDVTVTAPGGATVVLTSEIGQYDAETGGLSYTSLGRIDVEQAGIYTFETNGPEGASVRVGQLPIGSFVALLIGGIAIGAFGFLVALVLVIVTLVRRSRAKKQMVAATGYPGLSTPYPPMAPQGPPPPPPSGPPPPGTPQGPPPPPPAAPPPPPGQAAPPATPPGPPPPPAPGPQGPPMAPPPAPPASGPPG